MPTSPSTSLSYLRFAAALALVTAAGCNNFKKGTPGDGGADGPRDAAVADARGEEAAAGNSGQAGGGGNGGGGGHAGGGGASGNGGHAGGNGGQAGGGGNGGKGGQAGGGGNGGHAGSGGAGGAGGAALPTANLVAYYPFNGNTNDESGNGRNATADLGAFDTDRFGLANKAYNLIPNNSNDWYGIVSAPTLPISSDMSMAVWVKASPNNNNERIVGVGNWVGMQFSGQQVTFGNGGDQPAIVTDPTAITKNAWTFFVGTISSNGQGDFISLYRDGNLVVSQMFTDYFLAGSPGNCRFYMGNTLLGGVNQNCTGSSQAFEFPGDVDDVRVYARALSLAEVQALYHAQP